MEPLGNSHALHIDDPAVRDRSRLAANGLMLSGASKAAQAEQDHAKDALSSPMSLHKTHIFYIKTQIRSSLIHRPHGPSFTR